MRDAMRDLLKEVLRVIGTRYSGPPLTVTELSDVLGYDYRKVLWEHGALEVEMFRGLMAFWRSGKGFEAIAKLTQRTRLFEVVERGEWEGMSDV